MKNIIRYTIRKRKIPVLFALIFFLLASCGRNGNPGQEGPFVTRVDGQQVIPQDHSVSIRATGDLLSYEEVELKAPVSGNVLNIYFREGKYVNQGDLLVEIDNRSWTARKKGLEARLVSLESELRRKKDLLEIEGVSQEEVEQTQAEADNLKSQIEEMEVNIDLAHVRAPFSGRVGLRDFSLGAFLSQGAIITRLVQTDQIKVNFRLPARYSSLATNHKEVKITSAASADTAVAVVYAADPMISPSSRTLQVRALMDNKDGRFVAGDFVQVLFEVEQYPDALMVPAESVVSELNNQVVYIARNGKAKKLEVETGSRTRDMVHILNGLTPGDTVLTTGLMEIREGDRIEIRKPKAEDTR